MNLHSRAAMLEQIARRRRLIGTFDEINNRVTLNCVSGGLAMRWASVRAFGSWSGVVVTLAILMAFGLTIARAGSQPAATAPPAAPEEASAPSEPAANAPDAARDADEAQPHIIIAEHVILWENEIVTWDEVLERLRKLRPHGPLHPSFHFTNGVHAKEEKGWQFWHDEIMNVYGELFAPAGVTFASISPRGGRRYDAIRTADDLKPDPALARTGRVTIDGRPAAGAQVAVLPLEDNPNVATLGVALKGKRLRDPYDEDWISSDDAGRFTIYPKAQTYFLFVLHEAGVAVLPASAEVNDFDVRLEPWATITFTSTGDLPGQSDKLLSQSAGLSIRTTGMPPECPEFTIYEIKAEGEAVSVPVPPGNVVLRRSLDMGDGSSIGLPAKEFTIAPGAEHEVALDPPSPEEELEALELQRQLRERRGE
jgi:hypothetical protein